ncbi:MAG: hypothetical protein RIE06_29135 [Roseibium album]|uniref:hypothetical protein n=1 Tax=Roseibium album TaxID=311410 RepID=UPI000CF059B4|nr:hypothetical protein [Labrenzia sp. EL_142]
MKDTQSECNLAGLAIDFCRIASRKKQLRIHSTLRNTAEIMRFQTASFSVLFIKILCVTELSAEEIRYRCTDETVFLLQPGVDMNILFGNIRPAPEQKITFELQQVTPSDANNNRIEALISKRQPLILTESCSRSDIPVITAIEKVLAELNGTECGVTSWTTNAGKEVYHSLRFLDGRWQEKAVTLNYSYVQYRPQGYEVWRQGTCHRMDRN